MTRLPRDLTLFVVGLMIICAVALAVRSDYLLSVLLQAGIYAILAVSLQLIFGYAGQISLAHAAFFGIGAYTSAILTVHFRVPFLLALIAAGLASAIASLVLAPMAKQSVIYFAMSTLAFNLITNIVFGNGGNLTGGWNGLTGIPYPSLFGWVLSSKQQLLVLILVVVLIQYIFMRRLTSGRLGRNFRAIRDNQLAAQSIGINVGMTKTKGFILGCFWAGIAGSLMVHTYSFISPEPFSFNTSITLLLMVVLGGVGSFSGALMGAFGVTILDEVLNGIPLYRPIIYGACIILAMIFWKDGLQGLVDWIRTRIPFGARNPGKELPLGEGAPDSLDAFLRVPDHEVVRLQIDGVSKSFKGLRALTDVTFEVKSGQIVGLIGPNGAGKTTLINVISGLERPSSGKVSVQGENISRLPMFGVCERGIARTFQTTRLFNSMTVLENVVAGTSRKFRNDIVTPLFRSRKLREEEAQARSLALQLVHLVGLGNSANDLCANLSYGHRRLVEIARALATCPRVLLLDEPAAGLNLAEREALKDLILEIRERFRVSIVIVEHDLNLISQIADRVVVLNFGTNIANGTPEDIKQDVRVIDAYLGRRETEYA
ncbi:MAG: branched-chain amino acid ABC transporter ATP-binding protein/permease [Alicyclobacillus sp.]|nr:branched-chain amino acid ABC transporter ATP-binding protein/permease [Alicyclobacillus sp.]